MPIIQQVSKIPSITRPKRTELSTLRTESIAAPSALPPFPTAPARTLAVTSTLAAPTPSGTPPVTSDLLVAIILDSHEQIRTHVSFYVLLFLSVNASTSSLHLNQAYI